jgi:hypothetical protein
MSSPARKAGRSSGLRQAGFTRAETLNLPHDEDHLKSVVSDDEFAYMGRDITPTQILKVRLADLTEAGTVTFLDGENGVRDALIDRAAGYAYFGTVSGQLVKVRLSDFARVDVLPLGAGVRCAAPDDVASMAYVWLNDDTLVRVRLSDFTITGQAWSGWGHDLVGCAVDGLRGLGYYATPGMLIYQVRLGDPAILNIIYIPGTEWGLRYPLSGAIDPVAQYGYWMNWHRECECSSRCSCWLIGSLDVIDLKSFAPVDHETPGLTQVMLEMRVGRYLYLGNLGGYIDSRP